MIGTKMTHGMGLGNQLFCYVTTRCIAIDNGYDFSILGGENMANNMHSDCGLYFMDLDMGIKSNEEDYEAEYTEKDLRLYAGNSAGDIKNGVCVSDADDGLINVNDNTLIYGIMQSEKYFLSHLDDIKKWLKVKDEYDCYEYSKDNLCIIHLRCSDYLGMPELFLNKKYWLNGIKHMKKINPDMEFMIITNDVKEANKFLPGIPAYNFDLAKDYSIIKNAKYLLLANSSFTYFPAVTSETVRYILAPKYWARHNNSNGYWSSEQNIYESFHYMDRKGKVFEADECRKELESYKKNSSAYKHINEKPTGVCLLLMKIACKIRLSKYWTGRIVRSLKRRLLSVSK